MSENQKQTIQRDKGLDRLANKRDVSILSRIYNSKPV